MRSSFRWSALIFSCLATVTLAADPAGLDQKGKIELKSSGPIAFGPTGVLFVSDPADAKVYAVGVGKSSSDPAVNFKVEKLDGKLATAFDAAAGDIAVTDLAVQPGSSTAYLSVSIGKGANAKAVLAKVEADGKVTAVALDGVPYAKLEIADAPAPDQKDRRGNPTRNQSVTDLQFLDGKLFIAGLSNAAEASKLRSVYFPFNGKDTSTSVEIYHGAHGAVETNAPVRTFVPFNVGGQPTLLAAYTCTPLVSFPLSNLDSGSKVRGTTVAELGNRNQPLDIVSYEKGGKPYLLLANSARGVMKVDASNIAEQKGINERIADTAGLTYETLKDLQGVEQLDKFGNDRVVILSKGADGLTLTSAMLP